MLRGVFMQEVLNQLNSIFEVLEKDAAPPITDEEFQRLSGRLSLRIPTTVESLYKWHDGIEEIIPAYDFLSLSDAINQYEELIAFGEEFQDESFFNRNYLPILQFQDSYFFVDCTPNSENTIYYLSSFESENTLKRYDSLSQMLQIISEAYLSRAYYIEDELVLENLVLLQKIEKKYYSQEAWNNKECEWNKLCAEMEELRSINVSQAPSEEEVQLQELSAVFSLAAPADLRKESLISRLTQTHDERAIDFLVEFLSDANPEIIAKAAYGLGALRAREKLPELIKLTKHPAEVVRNLATHAITEIATSNDILLLRPLLELLTDEAALVRISAAEALGQLRNPIAVQPLINLLQDRRAGVRYHVIQVLGKIGDARAIEVLQQYKSSVLPDETQIIDQAINSIEKLNS
jgi:HEAT repeats/SMI1 / KNR4 family (SUKH-1)